MLFEKVPTADRVMSYGRLLGYDGYDPVYRFRDKNWVLLDFIRPNRTVGFNVARFHGKVGNLYNGFSESETGDPI